jgi:hypothetical protein
MMEVMIDARTMGGVLALSGTFSAALFAPANAELVPRMVFAEQFGWISCVACPDVRTALGQMEAARPGELVHIEWQFFQMLATSGAASRAAYYGIDYGPSVVFDGVDEVVGWTFGTDFSYETAFANHRATGSQLTVGAEVYLNDAARSGSATVTVQVANGETIPDIASARIRCAIYENDIQLLDKAWSFIGRAIVLDAPLTIDTSGELQIETATFGLDDPNAPVGARPWGPASNFRAIAFVQRDDNREILNAAQAVINVVSVEASSWGRIKAPYR